MEKIFLRTQNVKAQDETLEVLVSLILPDISGADPADHDERSLGVMDGNLVIKFGASFVPIGGGATLGKTKITVVDGDRVINWQTDVVPDGALTFAQKHGNSIANIQGHQDLDGIMTPYSPEYTYTLNADGTINILTLTTVFTGTITII